MRLKELTRNDAEKISFRRSG